MTRKRKKSEARSMHSGENDLRCLTVRHCVMYVMCLNE